VTTYDKIRLKGKTWWAENPNFTCGIIIVDNIGIVEGVWGDFDLF